MLRFGRIPDRNGGRARLRKHDSGVVHRREDACVEPLEEAIDRTREALARGQKPRLELHQPVREQWSRFVDKDQPERIGFAGENVDLGGNEAHREHAFGEATGLQAACC